MGVSGYSYCICTFQRRYAGRLAAEMAAAGASQVTIAQKTWEMSNNIMEVRKQLDMCRSVLAL